MIPLMKTKATPINWKISDWTLVDTKQYNERKNNPIKTQQFKNRRSDGALPMINSLAMPTPNPTVPKKQSTISV